MSTTSSRMRGLAFDRSAQQLVQLRADLPMPTARRGEVLVRVTHSSVNGYEFDMAASRALRALAWLRCAPGQVRTGLEFAGVVASDGQSFQAGEAVMGYIDIVAGWHTHSDYIAIPETYLAPLPLGVSAADAATVPMGALTALGALRDVAKIQPGQRLLIAGASGGVGLMAVQLARILGAHATTLSSDKHHALLARLGADTTLDYRQTPVSAIEGTFDAVLDFSATLYLKDVRHLLASGGVFVPADPMRNLWDVIRSRQAGYLMVDRGDGARLREIGAWMEQAKLRAVAGETFELADWRRAVARSHERGRLGRVVLAFG